MQIYFHSRLCSYLSRVPILVEGTVHIYICGEILENYVCFFFLFCHLIGYIVYNAKTFRQFTLKCPYSSWCLFILLVYSLLFSLQCEWLPCCCSFVFPLLSVAKQPPAPSAKSFPSYLGIIWWEKALTLCE